MMKRLDHAGLLDRRLVLVTGKGGVGKTTVAAALALVAVQHGRRVLLAQFESNADIGSLLGGPAVGTTVTPVREGLWAVNMTPRAALREYGMLIFRFRAIQRAVMENRMVKHFLAAIPGLDDYALLGKAWHHTTELVDGRAKYDLVVVDGPATGQMLRVLKVPRSILEVVPDSMLSRDARTIEGFLTNPERTACLVVTLAEEMPVAETLELEPALRDKLGLTVAAVVVNALYPRRRSAELLDLGAQAFESHPPLGAVYSEAAIFAQRRAVNDQHLAMLGDRVGSPLLRLPRLFVDDLGPAEIAILAQRFDQVLGAR